METTYKFLTYNKESLYGFGTEEEAQLYLDFLNKDKEIFYEIAESDLTDDEAEILAINLRDNLADLADIA